MNLAVADMTAGIFLALRYIFIHTFTHPDGVTGDVLCKLLTAGTWGWVGISTSVFSLVVIAIERYYAVLQPHGNKGRLSKRKIKVGIWSVLYYVKNGRRKKGAFLRKKAAFLQ